ncbi:MAG: hypothetical protein KA270_05465 [Saprospiraceae bacterium]|jgi:hypothetical protein|nr:hypothetical protein [Saprospiraceae bacterium]MBP6566596.1 hypothetical protein [Saprospiraceae bacterium]
MKISLIFSLLLKSAYLKINNKGDIFYIEPLSIEEKLSKFLIYDKNGNIILNEKGFNKGINHVCGEKFYYFKDRYELIEISDTLKISTLIEASDLLISYWFNSYFIYYDKYSFEKTNQLETPAIKYIYKLDELIWKYDKFGTIEIFSDRYALCFTDSNPIIDKRTRNQFLLLDLDKKTELWHFNLEGHIHKLHSIHPFDYPHKVGKPLGIYKDQLWFEMDNYGLMCLHKETGELIHYLRDLPYATGESYRGMPRVEQGYAVIPYTNEAILLKDESKIICFAIFYYWELDLETMQITYHYLKEYFQEVECYTFGSRFKPLELAGDLIYMVDNQHKKIGIFNRKTLRYEHIESLPEGSGAPRSMEKHGDRLYVDTFGKKLLVYQI